jgi:hypothetical protein
MRFQELMPDVLHWLGIRHIARFVSMSNMKHDAVVNAGISIGERVRIPSELIPKDARVEMDAKVAAGYYTDSVPPEPGELALAKGRALEPAPNPGVVVRTSDSAVVVEAAVAEAVSSRGVKPA